MIAFVLFCLLPFTGKCFFCGKFISSGYLDLCVLVATRPMLDGRIVGGHDVNIEDFPYQLSLQSYGRHICGASIISEQWALTAAHCVKYTDPKVVSFRSGSSIRGEGGNIHNAIQIFVHPLNQNLDYDYALVKVKITNF